MFNIVNTSSQECPEVRVGPLYFTGVYGSPPYYSEALIDAWECP